MGLLIGNVNNNILPARVKQAVYEDIPMYGVKFPSNSTVGVRTYDAAVLNWSRSSNTEAGVDDFKNLAPFNVKEVCRVWNGTTASYLYKTDYSDAEWQTIRNGTHATIDGDIMIEVPEFWYRRVDTIDGLEIIVAPEYKVGFTPDPWHYVDGVHHQKRYISKYPVGQNYKIRSGIERLTNLTMDIWRTNLRTKGLNMISMQAWYSLVMLMLVKYANTDVQATVSYGWKSGNVAHITGNADNVLGLDGSATSVSTNEAPLTLGIESFYGDCWCHVDGCFTYSNYVYIKDNPEDVIQNPTSEADLVGYTKISALLSDGEATIISIANDAIYDWAFLPSSSSGSTSIICNDTVWSASDLQCIVKGGNSWSGYGDSRAGLFAFAYNSSSLGTSGRYGTLAIC